MFFAAAKVLLRLECDGERIFLPVPQMTPGSATLRGFVAAACLRVFFVLKLLQFVLYLPPLVVNQRQCAVLGVDVHPQEGDALRRPHHFRPTNVKA